MEWATGQAGSALEYGSTFRTESVRTHQSIDKLLIMWRSPRDSNPWRDAIAGDLDSHGMRQCAGLGFIAQLLETECPRALGLLLNPRRQDETRAQVCGSGVAHTKGSETTGVSSFRLLHK